jgi:hypothetical protein
MTASVRAQRQQQQSDTVAHPAAWYIKTTACALWLLAAGNGAWTWAVVQWRLRNKRGVGIFFLKRVFKSTAAARPARALDAMR